MSLTLLHAVARKAEAITPDAELLARFARDRDHLAFEELVRRHGPLVWNVCRQMLPHHADAEDAFQAVFLALVRSAASIRDGRALPAWLHGVAIRVATRARRTFARRRLRDQAAAVPEADRSVPDAAWESLVAVVHEEVQRLPEAERTAFVLCDLEGVSQPDAAVRLGCPLGSVSGRLCKARQRLLERLTARGIAPAAVVSVGLTTGAASAVPAKLFDAVKTFPGSPTAASGVAAALARGLTEGVAMRVKLMAATAVVVTALGVTGGAVLLSKADAQPPGGGPSPGAPPGAGGFAGANGGFGGQPGGAGGSGGSAGQRPRQPGSPPAGAPGLPGPRGPQPGAAGPGMPGMSFGQTTWDYKFVDVESDRKAFEKAITQNGKDGWEFCSSERFGQNNVTLVFKKRKSGDFPFGGVGGGFGGAFDGGFGGPGGGVDGMIGGGGFGGPVGVVGGGNPDDALRNSGLWGAWGGRDGVEVRSFTLKNTSPADAAAALNKALPKGIKAVVPEPRTNRLLVVADASAMKDVAKLVEDIDAKSGDKAKPNAGPRPGGGGAGGNRTGSGQGSSSGPAGLGSSGSSGPRPGAGGGSSFGPVGPSSGGSSPFDPMGGMPGFGPKPAGQLTVITLKHAKAEEMGPLLTQVFPTVAITPDQRTNQLIIRADTKTMEELKTLLSALDVEVPKKR